MMWYFRSWSDAPLWMISREAAGEHGGNGHHTVAKLASPQPRKPSPPARSG